MTDPQDADRRLTELEIKATFAEDLLDHLNDTLTRQQTQIDLLIREVAELKRCLPERASGPFADPRDDLPPHY
jgi:SlyX protein